jgi:hypothetical protein
MFYNLFLLKDAILKIQTSASFPKPIEEVVIELKVHNGSQYNGPHFYIQHQRH